ncbi:cysteine dioxygenase [Chromobacterium alticapitis]|nr:cysteine dioxygenase family protein [Chromobacterium alticapitis]
MQTPAASSSPGTDEASLAVAIRLLSRLPGPFNLEQMRLFFHALRLSPSELAPFRLFDEDQYRRNRIHLNEHCELLLLCWQAGQRSKIHNHKGSLCGVRVLEGVATETVFERTPAGLAAPRETRELAVGSLAINADTDIHQVANLQTNGRPLVTLHLYSPPLRAMEAFSPDPRPRLLPREEDCPEFHI